MFCHLSVDFGSSSVVPGGIKLNGLADTYCNLAIQPGGGIGRVICDRVKNILPDRVHFVCSLTVSTLCVDKVFKICVNHKKMRKIFSVS